MDRTLTPREFAIIALVVLVIGLFMTREVDFHCPDVKSYCSLTTTNLFNIQNSKKLIAPSSIKSIDVESHAGWRSRGSGRGGYIGPMYRMVIRTKGGRVYYINKSTKRPDFFEKHSSEIMDCIANEQYPCKFHIY